MAQAFCIACELVDLMPAQTSPRLRCDPQVTVETLCHCIEAYLQAAGTRDVLKLLASLKGASWKHAPRLQHLTDHADLAKLLFTRTRARKLSHVGLKIASQKCHQSESGAILFGPSDVAIEVLASCMSLRIRVLLAKFRSLENLDTYRIALHQAVDMIFFYFCIHL